MLFIRSLLLVLSLLWTAPVVAEECLAYGSEVTLHGKLSRHTFPEQPNYESIAGGDTPATYFFVTSSTGFCVAAGHVADNEPEERSIERVQLVFSNAKESYTSLKAYLGKSVECRGTFFHAISGHHHSPVLLGEARCVPLMTTESLGK